MTKGFNLPIISEVPIETAAELSIREAQDNAYTLEKERQIKKRFMKLNSNTRKVADYIQNHFMEVISLRDISIACGNIKISTVKSIIADLNFWREFGYKLKRTKGKKNYVQSIKKDIGDTEKYLIAKSRTIATMEQVYGNINDDVRLSRKKKKNQTKVKVKAKN